MKILVLHPGALGDVILSLPALGLLRQQFPNAKPLLPETLTTSLSFPTATLTPLHLFSTLPLHRLFAPGTLTEEDRRFWQSYDRIACWMGAEAQLEFTREITGANPTALIASWRPAPGERRHVSLEIFVDSVKPWVGEIEGRPFARVCLHPEDRLSGENWLCQQGWTPGRPLIAVHPGAGSAAKRWPSGSIPVTGSPDRRGLKGQCFGYRGSSGARTGPKGCG